MSIHMNKKTIMLLTALSGILPSYTFAAEYNEAQLAMQYLLMAENVIEEPSELDTKLSDAFKRSEWHNISRLLAAGANPNPPPNQQATQQPNPEQTLTRTYLYQGITRAMDSRLLKKFIDAGADMKVQAHNNATLLHIFSECFKQFSAANPTRWKEFLNSLLDGGIDINQQTNDGVTALMIACNQGHLELVKHFVERGADCELTHSNGKKAIDFVPPGHKLSKEIQEALTIHTK